MRERCGSFGGQHMRKEWAESNMEVGDIRGRVSPHAWPQMVIS